MPHALRQFREDRKLSQDELARIIGTTKATVSRLESGERMPSADMLKKIARATKGAITPNDFFLRTGPFAGVQIPLGNGEHER